MQQEIGRWNAERQTLLVPISSGTSKRVRRLSPIVPSRLEGPLPWKTTMQMVAALNPQNEEVAGFFRIHDSGDLSVSKKPSEWLSYLAAWIKICKAFPAVWFWMPTRLWMFPQVATALANAQAECPNLVIRPSALHVGQASPELPGLPYGSTVSRQIGKFKWAPLPKGSIPTWKCPVRASKVWDPLLVPRTKKRRERGEMGDYTVQTSCLEVNCRACWGRTVHTTYGEKA